MTVRVSGVLQHSIWASLVSDDAQAPRSWLLQLGFAEDLLIPGERVDAIHHCQLDCHCPSRYTERLAEADAVASVGSKGDSYDNAMAEALNSLFKAECIRNPMMRPAGG